VSEATQPLLDQIMSLQQTIASKRSEWSSARAVLQVCAAFIPKHSLGARVFVVWNLSYLAACSYVVELSCHCWVAHDVL
jgi:hypothetical protein